MTISGDQPPTEREELSGSRGVRDSLRLSCAGMIQDPSHHPGPAKPLAPPPMPQQRSRPRPPPRPCRPARGRPGRLQPHGGADHRPGRRLLRSLRAEHDRDPVPLCLVGAGCQRLHRGPERARAGLRHRQRLSALSGPEGYGHPASRVRLGAAGHRRRCLPLAPVRSRWLWSVVERHPGSADSSSSVGCTRVRATGSSMAGRSAS